MFEKMPTWIVITSYRNFVSGAWGRQCYFGNKIRNVFDASCLVVSVCAKFY